MAEKKNVTGSGNDEIIAKAQDFWTRYQKQITIALAVIVLAIGGWYGYKNFVQNPKTAKAVDAMYKAEEYYAMDSLQKALNGDGINAGFVKIIKDYGGTAAGNLARFYAANCYLRLGDFNNAVKQLKEYSTSQKQVQARAYKLLADAYSELGKNDEAIENYKKASKHFPEDFHNSAEYLFMAASLAERSGKTNEAIELYKEVKEKFPDTVAEREAEKYLAKLGVYN